MLGDGGEWWRVGGGGGGSRGEECSGGERGEDLHPGLSVKVLAHQSTIEGNGREKPTLIESIGKMTECSEIPA